MTQFRVRAWNRKAVEPKGDWIAVAHFPYAGSRITVWLENTPIKPRVIKQVQGEDGASVWYTAVLRQKGKAARMSNQTQPVEEA